MRDFLIAGLIFGSIPFILARPWVGILMWSWVSYMSPHRLTWGFAYDMPFAQILALATLVGMAFSNEPKKIPFRSLTFLWIGFIAWMAVTTIFALYPEDALGQLEKVLKIQFVALLTLMLINTRERINYLIWVIVLSIGFFSLKGGLYTLLSGGAGRVWGPPGSFIYDNNSLALATLMTIPLMYYLRQQTQKGWVRWGLLFAMVLSALSALGSQSRGALVGGVVVTIFFWLKSRHKFATGLSLALLIPPLLIVMPDSWYERIATVVDTEQASPYDITTMYSRVSKKSLSAPMPNRDWFGYWPSDQSALGRINAWNYAINVANDRPTGAGFESWAPDAFAKYAPIPEEVQAAHSIFFAVLADHGWIGFFLFVTILATTWRYAGYTMARAKTSSDLTWAGELTRAIQISLLAYICGGAFLSLAYYDLPWHLIALVLMCRHLVDLQVQSEGSTVSREVRTGGPAPEQQPLARSIDN
jgi:hypothetical protein